MPFDGLRMWRLLSAPRPPDQPARLELGAAELFAAWTAAHAALVDRRDEGAAMAVAWVREPGQDQLRILVGGRPELPSVTGRGDPGPVLFPPGSVGTACDQDQLSVLCNDFPVWIRCHGQSDPLWTPQGRRETQRRGGFDDYVSHLPQPFAWVVLAEPLAADVADTELLRLATQIPRLRQRENSELDRVALERAQDRYRELARATAGGLWNVHILVGALDEPAGRQVTALLCGASDLDELPYALSPGKSSGSLREVWASRTAETTGPASPFCATAELLAAVARPPAREIAGIRLTERADFDLTPENRGRFRIGDVLNDADQPVGPFTVNASTLNRHTFVAGATGGGKSQTVRHLLEELHAAGVPWLVIEPAKSEYAGMAGRIGGDQVTVIRPGHADVIPVGLNPLEPEPGFPLQTHIDLIRALFLAAFEATEPFPQVLSQALNRCYTDLGWDPVLSESRLAGVTPKYPDLADLQATALAVVEGIGYGKEVHDNIRGFIDVRIGSLRLGTTGRFFEGGYTVDVAELLRRNVVLEIEDVGNDQDKAFFIGAMLIRLFEHLRMRPPRPGLAHVTVIEEAHRLLRRVTPGTPAEHAVELFTALLAEIRAYGEGIVVAEQIPTKIVPDVIKNTALKIIHRLPSGDDREAVGTTMNLDDAQSRHVVSLPPGRAVVFADGMDRPMRVGVPLGERRDDARTARRDVAVSRAPGAAWEVAAPAGGFRLREMALGSRLSGDPRLTVWIELLTIAHLVGLPAPRPVDGWLESLVARAGQPIVECAVRHLVTTAVAVRYGGLAGFYQPERLAEHLAGTALAELHGAPGDCVHPEVAWQAGPYRWYDVHLALRAADTEKSAPHPDTERWARRGLHLPGTTQEDQSRLLGQHPDTWRHDQQMIVGPGSPPRYTAAIAQFVQWPTPEEQLRAIREFLDVDTGWPPVVFEKAAG